MSVQALSQPCKMGPQQLHYGCIADALAPVGFADCCVAFHVTVPISVVLLGISAPLASNGRHDGILRRRREGACDLEN